MHLNTYCVNLYAHMKKKGQGYVHLEKDPG